MILSSSGLLARTVTATPLDLGKKRVNHDAIRSVVKTSARAEVGLVTSAGRVLRLGVIGLPALPENANLTASGGAAIKEFITLPKDEKPLGLMNLTSEKATLVIFTASGQVKRVNHDVPNSAKDWNIVKLDKNDYLVGAVQTADDSGNIILITDDAQLLHFPANTVRATGRQAGCVAGIKLAKGAKVIYGNVIDPVAQTLVATVAGKDAATANSLKVSSLSEFPAKGRATGGIRCHKFLSGEKYLVTAGAGNAPIHAATSTGGFVEVKDKLAKRDATGTVLSKSVAALCALPKFNK